MKSKLCATFAGAIFALGLNQHASAIDYTPVDIVSIAHLPDTGQTPEVIKDCDFVSGIPQGRTGAPGFWLKVRLQNKSANTEDIALVFNLRSDSTHMYDDHGILLAKTGINGKSDSIIPARMNAFKVHLKPEEQKVLIFKIPGKRFARGHFSIHSYNWFVFTGMQIDAAVSGVFYGILLLGLLTVVILLLRFREILLLEYLLFLIISAIQCLALDCYIWLDNFSWGWIFGLILPLSTLMLLFYVSHFTQIENRPLRVFKALAAIVVLLYLVHLCVFGSVHETGFGTIRNIFNLLSIGIAGYLAFRAAITGKVPGYFPFGILCYVVMSLLSIATWEELPLIGLVKLTPIYNHFAQIGSATEIAIFCVALIQRAKNLEIERHAIVENNQRVAHDLLAPLHMLQTYLLALKSGKKVPESIPQSVNEAISYAEGVANEILNPNDFKREAVNLREIIDTVFAQYPKTRYSLDLNHTKTLAVDHLQFSRVLNNLVKNAVEAIGADENIQIASNNTKNGIEISVGNTGSYIPESVRKQIFKSGYSSKKNGQGLGLAIVQKIVAAHGGTVTCQSDYQNGTQFLIEIPDQKIS